ncbi:MAG: hypothetical protein P1V51_09755 [Deltaproteobacteria bacterium]|nr:hypothetical protein [Deltaproteobacteria bacterium]
MPLCASAAVRVGQVYVRGAPGAEIGARVLAHLEAQGAGATEGRARRELLLIAPAKEGGWHLLLDSTPSGVDPTLARSLARPQEGKAPLEVLRLEVDGGTLSWARAASKGGELPDPVRVPDPGYGASPFEGPLPKLADVELLAWHWLAGHDIESGVRLAGLADFSEAAAGAGRPAISLEVKAGAPPSTREVRVRIPPPRKLPPTVADTELPTGVGAPGQTIDLIQLSGEPEPAALRQLAKVLLAIQRRHHQAEPKRPFCHLVEEPYLEPLYALLARQKGPCQKTYRELLEKARKRPAPTNPRPSLRLPEAHGE